MKYLLLATAWSGYLGVHSALATQRVKNFFGWQPQTYRLLYVVFASIGLLALVIFNASIQSALIIERSNATRYSGLLLATAGLLVWQAAFKNYQFTSFIGLRNEPNTFHQAGILAKVRHPIYSGS